MPWEGRAGRPWASWSGRRRWLVLGAILLVVALGVAGLARARAERWRRTRLAIDETRRALAAFRREYGRCPGSLEELVRAGRPGRRWLREPPRDGWGRLLYVRCPGHFDPDDADVLSAGPDGDFFDAENVR